MKRIIQTDKAPAPIGPYSQAVEFGNTLYVSGQVAIDPVSNEVIQGEIEDEAHLVMKNISAILGEAGYALGDIVKTSIFLSDMALFARVNAVYGSYFEDDFPARETVAVKGLPKNVNVEITVIACKTLADG
ncbi:RidA family protein [Hufsiella ginkgonis]|uniref:RidA family protein n=1 Tax=Hufsiella ginkgonis TaxID=2695274 RepID=A0A7K1XSU3_9SPHI|nr:RidA family protein [Hufsiella ginkgonis]MXV13947.1 RidA family protein [Hufsiella ginkgonis]